MAYSDSFNKEFTLSGIWVTPSPGSVGRIGVDINISDPVVSGTQLRDVTLTLSDYGVQDSESPGSTWSVAGLFPQLYVLLNNTEWGGPYTSWPGKELKFTRKMVDHDSGKIRIRLSTGDGINQSLDILDLSIAINDPPSVTVTGVPAQWVAGGTYPITVYISDPESDALTGNISFNYRVGNVMHGSSLTNSPRIGTTVFNVKIPEEAIGGTGWIYWNIRDVAGNNVVGDTGRTVKIIQNNPPSAVFNITGVNPGGTASIKWTYSDPDGHAVKTKSLVRYYQAKGSTTWQTTALTVSADSTSATDAIPLSYNGGTVYYVLKFEDEYGAAGELKSSNYTLQTVTPPTMPPSITYPSTINGGETITISWGASTDQENNLAGYEVEGTYNGSTWFQVYKAAQPNTRTTTALVEYGQNTITYRVRAYDTTNLYSDWKIGNTVTIVNNQAPTIPASITVPATVVAGQAVVIKWGASTDPDGDAVSYELQRQVNGGSFTVVGTTAGLNYTDTIGSDWTTVVYRVRAKDAKGAYSGFRTAPSRTVTQNRIPTIQCEYQNDQDLGIKSETFSFTYSVNDEDASDTLTVREYIDGAQIKSFVATRNQTYTFDFANNTKWKSLVNGEHTIRISVTDGKATKNLNLTFIKATSGCTITLTNPISVAETIKYAVLSVSFTLPYENLWTSAGVFNLEVFNRGFHRIDAKAIEGAGTGDAWEECLIDPSETYENKGNIFKQGNNILIAMKEGHVMMIHKFTTTGNKFNYRLIADSDEVDDLGHICSVQGAIGVNDIVFPANLNG